MDFFAAYSKFIKEVLEFKSFKKLGRLKTILYLIVCWPFVLIFISLMLVFSALVVAVKAFSVPALYLEQYIKEKANKDRLYHATQFIAYFVAFPSLFGLQVFLAIISVSLFVLFLFVELIGYIATAGGISFQPFITDYSAEKANNYEFEERSNKYTYVFLIINGCLLLTFIVLYLIGIFTYNTECLIFAFVIDRIYTLSTIIMSLFIVSRKKNKEVELIESEENK